MATPVYPGQFNTYVESVEATQNMLVDFSRNPSRFALPQYVQYVPVSLNKGLYTRMTIEPAGRLLTPDGADALWADGTDAPRHTGTNESFTFEKYVCKRYVDGFEVGNDAAEQASWDLLAQSARITAQRAMTRRTNIVVSQMTNLANYAADKEFDVDSAPISLAGKLDAALSTNMDLKRTLDYCALNITKDVLSAVQPSDIQFVMNPVTANALSNSQEIRDYLKQNTTSFQMIEGAKYTNAENYGLPPKLYGYNIVVEDAVKVTGKKGAASIVKDYCLADGQIVVTSRVGGLEGVEGAQSFSTWQVFFKEEMIVESKNDADNKRNVGRIIDYYDVQQVSPLTGMIIYNAITGTP